jgi:Flp pilus assembly protein TadD
MKESMSHYYESLKSEPDDSLALNNLAWMRATCPQAALRNGGEAVKLAQRAVRLSNGREALAVGTLAAAYAEAGRFPEAVQTARQAIDLARRQNKRALAEDTEARLRLYMAKTPYHEPAPVSPPPPP